MKKWIVRDLVGVWLLLTGCLITGLVINEMRPRPLALVYSPPASRLDETVTQMGASSTPPIALEGDVDRGEMQKISSDHLATILDARPEIFYRLGHIPSALSLPRDDFEKQYPVMKSVLQAHHDDALVVYCSGPDCHDSQMVADALQKLGYPHVRLFRGGWSDWENANLPEEKE
jgi:rhodanese-related sulfurtransferase